MSSHAEIIKKFAERKLNSRGLIEWAGSRVFCNGENLYSYGSHFILARYLGEKDGKPIFLKNTDKYSKSTSTHQGITKDCCPGPSISFNALYQLGIAIASIKVEDILDFRAPFWEWCYKDTKTNRYYKKLHTRREEGWRSSEEDVPVVDSSSPFFTGAFEEQLVEDEWKPPELGHFQQSYKRKHDAFDRIRQGSWVIDEATLLKHKEGRRQAVYLCTLDKVIKVPKQVSTIVEAEKLVELKAA